MKIIYSFILFVLIVFQSNQNIHAGEARSEYEKFARSLNLQKFKNGYPAVIRKLNSNCKKEQEVALKTIGQSGEIDAIPLLVNIVLNNQDRSLRIYAALALEEIVSSNELKRRDFKQPGMIVILPRTSKDVDLRPLAWVLGEMLAQPEEANIHSYTATMIGYLGLKQFEPNLRELLKSRHPAVTRSAVYALKIMNFKVDQEPHPINQPLALKRTDLYVPEKVKSSVIKKLGLSSTGEIKVIGKYRLTQDCDLGKENDEIVHLIQKDLFGKRLFWSCLVNITRGKIQVLYRCQKPDNFGTMIIIAKETP